MDSERARQLLADERTRIENALAKRKPADVGELADQDEPADRASELYTDELDEGISDDLREALGAVERAEARLSKERTGFLSKVASRSRTTASKPSPRPSELSRSRNATSTAEAELYPDIADWRLISGFCILRPPSRALF